MADLLAEVRLFRPVDLTWRDRACRWLVRYFFGHGWRDERTTIYVMVGPVDGAWGADFRPVPYRHNGRNVYGFTFVPSPPPEPGP